MEYHSKKTRGGSRSTRRYKILFVDVDRKSKLTRNYTLKIDLRCNQHLSASSISQAPFRFVVVFSVVCFKPFLGFEFGLWFINESFVERIFVSSALVMKEITRRETNCIYLSHWKHSRLGRAHC